MIGFGGGSSYTALLGTSNISYAHIPIISLICNLIVVSGGSWNYFRNDQLDFKFALPFLVSSIPMSFLAGKLHISESSFYMILGVTLFLCGVRTLFINVKGRAEISKPHMLLSVLVGGAIGFLSGVVGIGGGIFLSPLLINFGWTHARGAAACACIFILFNSAAGLFGQLLKSTHFEFNYYYISFFGAVLIGGQVGSRISSKSMISHKFIQKGTGLLTLAVGVRLLVREFF